MKLTAPGRLAAAPRGGTESDRETRIRFGALTRPRPLVACGDLSPGDWLHAARVARGAVEQLTCNQRRCAR